MISLQIRGDVQKYFACCNFHNNRIVNPGPFFPANFVSLESKTYLIFLQTWGPSLWLLKITSAVILVTEEWIMLSIWPRKTGRTPVHKESKLIFDVKVFGEELCENILIAYVNSMLKVCQLGTKSVQDIGLYERNEKKRFYCALWETSIKHLV